MRKTRPYGSVRGAARKGRSYRDIEPATSSFLRNLVFRAGYQLKSELLCLARKPL